MTRLFICVIQIFRISHAARRLPVFSGILRKLISGIRIFALSWLSGTGLPLVVDIFHFPSFQLSWCAQLPTAWSCRDHVFRSIREIAWETNRCSPTRISHLHLRGRIERLHLASLLRSFGYVWAPVRPYRKPAVLIYVPASALWHDRKKSRLRISFSKSSHCSSYISGEVLPIIGGY